MRLDLGELGERAPARVVAPDAERAREPRVAGRPATQGSSGSHWPACTTTWSPTSTFVTSVPTAYTMPLASEPTMWKSVGSPQRACVFVTSTGIPRAAQTLLKFTPPAIDHHERVVRTELGDVDHLVLDRLLGLAEPIGAHDLRVHLRGHLADRRQLADLVQVLAHGSHPSRSDGPGNPSKAVRRATGRGERVLVRGRRRHRGRTAEPLTGEPARPGRAVLAAPGRNDAFMSSRLNAPEASPVVA